MKILVFSDSHGNASYMRKVISEQKPDLICHLGDGARDIAKLSREDVSVPIEQVRGNCDFASFLDTEKLLVCRGVRILLTHGHLYQVKAGYESIRQKARDMGVDIVCFGHTHRADYRYETDLHLLNPGSIQGRGAPATFGIILLEKDQILCYTCNARNLAEEKTARPT